MSTLERRRARRTAVALAALLSVGGPVTSARAQSLPDEPLVAGGGRLTVGGDVSVVGSCAHSNLPGAASCTDDTGFFNYTDYDHSALRTLRVDVDARLRATAHLSVLGEIRTENGNSLQAYALYARIRPWLARDFDIQVGRVPPTFGAFARRTYAADNILIGYPLAYQYLTSLRPDALPANADELLRMRGRGWLSNFSIGDLSPRHGMPIASVFRWDTGVQAHLAAGIVEATASVTMGTLGNPLVLDDNTGKQVSGRVSIHPSPGLILGLSGAHGPFVASSAARSAGVSGSFTQTAWGADAEYSRAYYLIRAEAIVSDWRLPFIAELPLRAVSTSVEARYKVQPRLYLAARFDHLGFSTITGTSGAQTWDAPVDRLEVGTGYSLERNLQLKVSLQHNTRDTAHASKVNIGALELVYWF